MRAYLSNLLLGAVACFVAAPVLSAQAADQPAQAAAVNRYDIAVTYSTARSNVVAGSNFWMQGGGIQAHGLFYRGLGAVADLSGLHQGSVQSGVGLDLITVTIGPRYTWQSAHGRYAFYGQGLGGVASGFNSDFPGPLFVRYSAQSLAVKAGGGINIRLTPRIGFRAVEADWLHTQFRNSSNGAQSTLQLSTGVVFRF